MLQGDYRQFCRSLTKMNVDWYWTPGDLLCSPSMMEQLSLQWNLSMTDTIGNQHFVSIEHCQACISREFKDVWCACMCACLMCMSDVHVCMYKHLILGGVWGHAPPGIFYIEIRCSEIASEAILGQKQSCSTYISCIVLHPGFACPDMASWHPWNFQERRYNGWQNSRWGEKWWNSVQTILKIVHKYFRGKSRLIQDVYRPW